MRVKLDKSTKKNKSNIFMALKGKLLKLLENKIVVVKNIMQNLPLDSIPC
jgi:hypothetical protein